VAGTRFNLEPFKDQCIAWEIEVEEAEQIKNRGLVLAEYLRHGDGMPVVEEYNRRVRTTQRPVRRWTFPA